MVLRFLRVETLQLFGMAGTKADYNPLVIMCTLSKVVIGQY